MCDDYGDYEDWEDDSEDGSEDNCIDPQSFNAGYEAAKKDLVKFATSKPKRDAQGRFANS